MDDMETVGPGAQAPICLALTGASGAQYGLRLLECLLAAGRTVYLLVSPAARVVLSEECGLSLPRRARDAARGFRERLNVSCGRLHVFGESEWTAPVASGSAPLRAMVVCPCSTGSLSAIAHGASDNLIERAADVAIKEGRKLVLVVRETPLSAIHLENMLQLARLGVVVMPASPGFYQRPTSVEAMVDFMVARILDQLGEPQRLLSPWGLRRL